MNMFCIHTNVGVYCTHTHMHTQTNIPLAPQELKEREGVDFSTDLSPSQSNSRQSQVCSNPNQSEMMMSSHFFHIRALIRCRRTTV